MYNFTSLDKVVLHPFFKKFKRISLLVFFIFSCFLFLPWQQTIKGVGSLIALDPTQRAYSILATIDGFIDEFHVQENQFVKKGELLFTMVDLDKEYASKLNSIQENMDLQKNNIKNQILISKEKRDNTKEYLSLGLNVYVQKFDQIKNILKSLEIKKIAFVKNYEIERSNFERVELLYKDGIESRRRYEQLNNIYIKAKAQRDKLSVDVDIEKNNISILEKEKKKFLKETENKIKTLEGIILGSQNELNSLQQKMHKQSMTISRYESSKVYAKKDGYVVRLQQNDKNKLIHRGDKVLYFAPVVTKKSILIKFSDFNMPLVQEGLPARIVFYGWPAMQVSGWPLIERGTFAGIIERTDAIAYEKGFYYAYVVEDPSEPWPQGDILKIGTQATVWVRLESVAIWYQLWRTMNALPPRLIKTDKKQNK